MNINILFVLFFDNMDSFSGYKLIHIAQNLFFYVGVNSNLAIEFNGLVSNGVSRNANPFTFWQLLQQTFAKSNSSI
jgi:hypothetical protein